MFYVAGLPREAPPLPQRLWHGLRGLLRLPGLGDVGPQEIGLSLVLWVRPTRVLCCSVRGY